ncbi:MAG: dienelactone hydrolase family protein [Phycisphaerae bacterium]|nr:dienelactone hydrolase family protein [Phycisphaerae bacterium]
MKFFAKTFGDAPTGGRSLVISMHGGGGAPTQVNDQQWENQKRLYELKEGIYVAPRAPGDTWDLWHQGHIDGLFDRLIEDLVIVEDVNPDRVYIMGYSAGGDGVFQLAPRMADRFAAAAMMAGHPNETRPDGLRNLPFTLHMGGKDGAFKRNEVAAQWKTLLADLHAADPKGYVNEVVIHPGKGHWMDREDAVAIPWMAAHTRDLRPTKIVWLQDDVTHSRFYWLAVDDPKARERIVVERDGQTIRVVEAPAEKRLRIRLDDSMLDLDKPVVVLQGEKELFRGNVERSPAVIDATLNERGDRQGIWTAEVAVTTLPATP